LSKEGKIIRHQTLLKDRPHALFAPTKVVDDAIALIMTDLLPGKSDKREERFTCS